MTFPSGRTADALKITHPSAIIWAAQMGIGDTSPVAGAMPGHRAPRRAAHRSRPAARHRFHGGRERRCRRPQATARRTRAGRLSEDLRWPRCSRLPPDQDGLGFRRGAPRRHRAGPRGRAARAGRGDDVVVEGGTREADLHRLQPERPRPHVRVGVFGAQDTHRDGVDTADVGRTARRRPRRLHHRHGARYRRRPRRSVGRHRRPRAVDRTAAGDGRPPTRTAISGTCPTRRAIPKMPGEPPRVQPSKKVAAHWDEHGNRVAE